MLTQYMISATYIITSSSCYEMNILFVDLPRALYRLFKNKMYLMIVCAMCFEVYISGFFTFLPKYLEQHFGLTASNASIMTGK